jgi:adenosylhomocysteine nucleosidase
MLRSLLTAWLQKAAKAKLQETVVQAARGDCPDFRGSENGTVPLNAAQLAEGPKPCHLGVVFALGIESGCFEDTLRGIVTIRGSGFVAREGGLHGRRVVMLLAGPGRTNAAQATEILILGHKPGRVLSVGFAGGLCPELKRNDILIADRLLNKEGEELSLDVPNGLSAAIGPGVHRGALLTADAVVRLPGEKKLLFQRSGAMAVDMETFAVAEVCRRRNVAFSSIRVINDTADEQLPKDVNYLLTRKTRAAQWGAALGTACHRPGSIKDMYQLRENALVASGRLAKFLWQIQWDSM